MSMMSDDLNDRVIDKLEGVALSGFTTFVLGVVMIFLGFSTRAYELNELPMRDFLVMLSFIAGSCGLIASVIWRRAMPVAHRYMGLMMIVYGTIRGATFAAATWRSENLADLGTQDRMYELVNDSARTWGWAVFVVCGVIFWAMARREHRSHLRSERAITSRG